VSEQATDPEAGVGPVQADPDPLVEREGRPDASPPPNERPSIFELAWPSITTNILQSIVGIVDMAIVGRVSVDAQAAVGSGYRIFFIGQAVMMAITAGTTALVARSWGAADRVEAERATHASLIVCTVLSLVLCAVGVLLAAPLAATFGLPATTTARTAEFIRWLSAFHLGFTIQFVIGVALRATGDVITPLLVGALTNVLNVVLVYGLVFGELPGIPLPIDPMGVRGAAIASGLAFTAGSVVMFGLYLAGRLNVRPRRAGSLTLDRVRRLWHIGYPSGLEQAVFQGGFYVFIVIVSQYGTAPNAAYNIGVQLLSLSFVIGFGYSIAASTLVGQHLGAGEPGQATQAGWHCMRLSIYSMVVLGIVIVTSAPWIAPFFNEDPEVVRLTVVFINVLGLVQPLMAIEFSLSGALRGAGDTRWPLISVMSGFIGVRLTLALLFLWLRLPVEWIYGALIGDYIVKSLVLTARFGRGRWQLMKV
jgi:putative MATE family efflux protein